MLWWIRYDSLTKAGLDELASTRKQHPYLRLHWQQPASKPVTSELAVNELRVALRRCDLAVLEAYKAIATAAEYPVIALRGMSTVNRRIQFEKRLESVVVSDGWSFAAKLKPLLHRVVSGLDSGGRDDLARMIEDSVKESTTANPLKVVYDAVNGESRKRSPHNNLQVMAGVPRKKPRSAPSASGQQDEVEARAIGAMESPSLEERVLLAEARACRAEADLIRQRHEQQREKAQWDDLNTTISQLNDHIKALVSENDVPSDKIKCAMIKKRDELLEKHVSFLCNN